MPRHCSAGGCKSRDNRETRNAGVTFHRLPKEATRRSLWITNSHRPNSWDPQTDFVYFCSKHFTPESFELTGCSGIRRLKEDAFPTVFDSSPTAKCKRRAMPPKCADRKNSGEETELGPTLEEGRRSRAERRPSSSGALAEVERLSPSPPPSPSRYMRRLPPPPGFYLPKEHSYAQLCPLLWRRRYDQAIDCLEKALRQLHAARRRENRLRSAVLRLRDKRLKHTLLVSRDGPKHRGGWIPEAEGRGGRGEDRSEDSGQLEDRCGDQMDQAGAGLHPDTSRWSEDKGFCFYCGRGRLGGRLTQPTGDVQPAEPTDSAKTSEGGSRVTPERPPGDEAGLPAPLPPVLLQSFQPAVPGAASLPDARELNLSFLEPQQEPLLSEGGDGESEGPESHQDLCPQLFWIQGDAEAQLILLPLPAEDCLQGLLKMEGVGDDAQTVLVSELDLKTEFSPTTEGDGGLSGVQMLCEDKQGNQRSAVDSSTVEMREDVREKLKEHLEGFHLQLSTEFRN